MRSVKSIAGAGVAALLSTAAFAADMPSIMPPPPPAYAAPVVEDFGGWYLRGDIGMSNQQVSSLFNVLYNAPGTTVQGVGHGFDAAPSFGIGAGYKFNNWFRADVTAEWRGKAAFRGLDIVSNGGAVVGTDEYRASKSELLFLANVYADLGTWWCITPFIGAGIGVSRNTISGFTDINTPTAGVAYAPEASKWQMAYALHAGLGYKVTNNLTLELSYRYLHVGNAASGDIVTYTGVNAVVNPMEFRGISSNDVRVGIRWQCCEPQAPVQQPVLMRRG
jgi:opacity protein-like surface antigen